MLTEAPGQIGERRSIHVCLMTVVAGVLPGVHQSLCPKVCANGLAGRATCPQHGVMHAYRHGERARAPERQGARPEHPIVRLQRAVGNAAVAQALLQRKIGLEIETALPASRAVEDEDGTLRDREVRKQLRHQPIADVQGTLGGRERVRPKERMYECPGWYATAATNTLGRPVQRDISFGRAEDVKESHFTAFRTMIEATPFTNRHLVDGPTARWRLHVTLITDKSRPPGLTWLPTNRSNLVRIEVSIAHHSPKSRDPNRFMGKLLATFLHEWEVHGVNRVTASKPPTALDDFLEHYALGKGRITSIAQLLSSSTPVPELEKLSLDIATIRGFAQTEYQSDVLHHSPVYTKKLLWGDSADGEKWKKTARKIRWEMDEALESTTFGEQWSEEFLSPAPDDFDDLWEDYLDGLVEWAEEGMLGEWEGSEDETFMRVLDSRFKALDDFMSKVFANSGAKTDTPSLRTDEGSPPKRTEGRSTEEIYRAYVEHVKALNRRGLHASRQFIKEGAGLVAIAALPGGLSASTTPLRGWKLNEGSTLPNLGSWGPLGDESWNAD